MVLDPDAYLTNIGPDSMEIRLENYGNNRINNVAQHSIKCYYNNTIVKKIRFHMNSRINWKYGQKDMLDIFMKVHNKYGTESTKNEMNDIYDVLNKYGYTKPSFTSNFSISWNPNFIKNSKLYIHAMNLIQYNHIRYVYPYWEPGNNRQYPRHIGFIIEPPSVFFKWTYQFK